MQVVMIKRVTKTYVTPNRNGGCDVFEVLKNTLNLLLLYTTASLPSPPPSPPPSLPSLPSAPPSPSSAPETYVISNETNDTIATTLFILTVHVEPETFLGASGKRLKKLET